MTAKMGGEDLVGLEMKRLCHKREGEREEIGDCVCP